MWVSCPSRRRSVRRSSGLARSLWPQVVAEPARELRHEVDERVRLLAAVLESRPCAGSRGSRPAPPASGSAPAGSGAAPCRRTGARARRRTAPSARCARIRPPRWRRPDPVARVAEPVVHGAAVSSVPKNGRWSPATSIGPPQAASIGTSRNDGNIRCRSCAATRSDALVVGEAGVDVPREVRLHPADAERDPPVRRRPAGSAARSGSRRRRSPSVQPISCERSGAGAVITM